jgi:hypothetical protein
MVPGTLNVSWKGASGKIEQASIADFGHYPIYSTVSLAKTQNAQLTYFQTPVGGTKPGGAGTTNTRLDTNMTTQGQLDSYGEMLVYAMRLEITPSQGSVAGAAPIIGSCNLADMNEIISKVYSSFTTSTEKPLIEGAVTLFPAAAGIFGTTTQNASEAWTNGVPSAQAGRQLASPIFIPGLTNFRVEQQFLPALALTTNTRDVRIVLDGLRKKAVQ